MRFFVNYSPQVKVSVAEDVDDNYTWRRTMKLAEKLADEGNYFQSVHLYQDIFSQPAVFQALSDKNKSILHKSLGKVDPSPPQSIL